MPKRVAIVQSSYVPWKGFFDLINSVDELILLDDVQFTRRDWRNRNRVKTPRGVAWLTIPVQVKGQYHQKICETRVVGPDWRQTHWKTLRTCYGRAGHFREYAGRIEELYDTCDYDRLSDINHHFITAICDILGINTKITWSMSREKPDDRVGRIVELCRQAEATEYLSGPSAASYLDQAHFDRLDIRVRWMDYSGYPEYPQLFPPFDHHVTILDLLFNTGPAATSYMKTLT